MKPIKITLSFFITSILTILLFLVTMYIFDPLQLFHKQWIYKKSLSPYMRQQAAGIINNKDFDSIILGTSMLENTSAKEASNILGGNFTNISLSGSDYYERKPVLDYALQTKQIQKVIYSLDIIQPSKRSTSDYDYLYDNNELNDFYVYTNLKYIGCIIKKSLCLPDNIDLDRPNAWHNIEKHSRRFGGLDNWFKYKEDKQVKASFKTVLDSIKSIEKGTIIQYDVNERSSNMKQYLDKYLISSILDYQDTEFILIVPPYSRIKYALMAQYNKPDFEVYINTMKYLVNQSSKYPNLKIYAWGNEAFVDEIKNYKDLTHYKYTFNSWMLKQISLQKGLLTNGNIDSYIKEFRKKSLDFNLYELGSKIELFLNSK